jgi:hypothetical protein
MCHKKEILLCYAVANCQKGMPTCFHLLATLHNKNNNFNIYEEYFYTHI